MAILARDPWADAPSTLAAFPDHVLLDIARNDAAEHRYRKLAVEILANRKSPKIQHPELQPFLHELKIELEGIQFEHPAPGPGPLIASVTTETLNAPESQVESVSTPELADETSVSTEDPNAP